MDALPDQAEIGPYRVVRLLGQGAVAITYQALDTRLHRHVVLTELFVRGRSRREGGLVHGVDADEETARNALRGFLGEVRRLQGVSRALAAFHEAFVDHGTLYVVTEYVEGRDLAASLAAIFRVPDDQALRRMFEPVLDAVAEIHDAGLIHGEIRPSNIILRPDGRAALVGFGVGRLMRAASGVKSETPLAEDAFAAPERLAGGQGAAIGPWTDVFSLGAVLYAATPETPPFSSRQGLIGDLLSRARASGGFNPQLLLGIEQALELDPLRRPRSIRALKGALGWLPHGWRRDEAEVAPLSTAELLARHPRRPARSESPSPAAAAPQASARPVIPMAAPPAWSELSRRAPINLVKLGLVAGGVVLVVVLIAVGLPKALAAMAKFVRPGALPPLPVPAQDAPDKGELVDVSVFVPPVAAPGEAFLVQALVHAFGAEAADIAAMAFDADPSARRRGAATLEVEIARGERLELAIDAVGLEIEEPLQTLVWRGRPGSVQFLLRIPEGFPASTVQVRLRVLRASIPVGQVRFALTVSPSVRPGPAEPAGDSAVRFRRAFLSYASADQVEVLKRAQALHAARIEVFQDLISLKSGEAWAQRLFDEIDQCDCSCCSGPKRRALPNGWPRKSTTRSICGVSPATGNRRSCPSSSKGRPRRRLRNASGTCISTTRSAT